MLAIDTGTNDLSPVMNLLYDIKNNLNNGHSTFKARGTITEDNFMNIDDFKTHTNNKMNLYIMNKNADFTVDAFNTITFDSISGSFGLTSSCYSTQSVSGTAFGSYITTDQTIYTSMEDRVIDNTDNVGIYPWTNKNYDGYIVKFNTNSNLPDLKEYSFKSLTQYFEQDFANSIKLDWNNKLNTLEEFCFVDATNTFTTYINGFTFKFDSNQSIKNIFVTNQNNPAISFSDVKASNLTYNNLMESGANLLKFENCDVKNFYADGYFNGFSSSTNSSSAYPKIENATISVSHSLNELPYDLLNIQNLTVNNISNKFQDCKLGNVDFCNSGSHYFISLNMFDNACLSNFGTVHFNYYIAPDASLTVKNGDVAIFDPFSCRLNELSVENLNSVDFSLSWWWNPTKLICNSVKSLTFSNLLDKPPMTIKNCSNVKFTHITQAPNYTATFYNCSFDNIDTLSLKNFVMSNCSINDIHNFSLSNGTFSECNINNIVGSGVGSIVIKQPIIESELDISDFGNLTLSSINQQDKNVNLYSINSLNFEATTYNININNLKLNNLTSAVFGLNNAVGMINYGDFQNINSLTLSLPIFVKYFNNGASFKNINDFYVERGTCWKFSIDNVDKFKIYNGTISSCDNLTFKSFTGEQALISSIENLSIKTLFGNNLSINSIKNLTIDNYGNILTNMRIRDFDNIYLKSLPSNGFIEIAGKNWNIENVSSTRLNWLSGESLNVSSMTLYTRTDAWFGSAQTINCENMFVLSNAGNYTFKNVNDITINNMFFDGSNQLLFSSFDNLSIGSIASNTKESLTVSGSNHNNITINNFENLKSMNLINNNQIKLNSGSVYYLNVSNSQIGGSLTLSNVSMGNGDFKNLSFADFGNGECDEEIRISNVLNCVNPFIYCHDVYIDAAHSANLSNYVEDWDVSHILY